MLGSNESRGPRNDRRRSARAFPHAISSAQRHWDNADDRSIEIRSTGTRVRAVAGRADEQPTVEVAEIGFDVKVVDGGDAEHAAVIVHGRPLTRAIAIEVS